MSAVMCIRIPFAFFLAFLAKSKMRKSRVYDFLLSNFKVFSFLLIKILRAKPCIDLSP